jgi:hypothetical protein
VVALSYLIIRTTEQGVVLTGWGLLILWVLSAAVGGMGRRD